MRRTCEHCGVVFDADGGRGRTARFCSTRCRVARHRAKAPKPHPLASMPVWVVGEGEPRPLSDHGKDSKPLLKLTHNLICVRAGDPSTVEAYAQARQLDVLHRQETPEGAVIIAAAEGWGSRSVFWRGEELEVLANGERLEGVNPHGN